MPTITRNVVVSVDLSPFEMGIEFAKMGSGEQAMFFQGVSAETKCWGKDSTYQWAGMREDLNKFPDGLQEFKSIAQHAEDS